MSADDQQCGSDDPVEIALYIVDQDAKDAGDFFGRQDAVDQTLAAEVRRLREELEVERVAKHLINKSLDREFEIRGHAEWLAEQLTALNAKLARVEEWYARTTTSEPDELCDAMDELGNKILRGE